MAKTQPQITASFSSFSKMLQVLPNEAACREYLETLLWKGEPVCPHCGCKNVNHYKLKTKGEFKGLYKCKDCRERFTVTVGTIFEGSHIDLRKWFIAIYIFSSHKKGISSHQLAKDLGVTQKSAWFMLHRIREVLRDKHPAMLGNIVEVDETYIGGKYKNKHKSVRKAAHESNASHTDNKTCVVALLERNNKVKTHIQDGNVQTLKDTVKQHVNKSATVFTDSLNAYKGLEKHFATHEFVNHNLDEYVRGEVYTNSVEGFFSLLKRGIYGIYHQVSKKHLAKYCDEFAARYNTRKIKDNTRFNFSLESTATNRITYKQLISKQ